MRDFSTCTCGTYANYGAGGFYTFPTVNRADTSKLAKRLNARNFGAELNRLAAKRD